MGQLIKKTDAQLQQDVLHELRSAAIVRELSVVVLFGLIAWAIGTATMWMTFWLASVKTGFAVRAIVAPIAFYLVSIQYFHRRHALRALFAAMLFACVELAADGAVALVVDARVYDIPRSLLGTWLPAALVLLVTWLTGIAMEQETSRDEAKWNERDSLP
jgi:hypothetical protein